MSGHYVYDRDGALVTWATVADTYWYALWSFGAVGEPETPPVEIDHQWMHAHVKITGPNIQWVVTNNDDIILASWTHTLPASARGPFRHEWRTGYGYLDDLWIADGQRPHRRIYPRDDGLGSGGAPRTWPPSRATQSSNRTTGGYL